eukprot:1139894-Pelagomonas_calceolata.AAC.4
MERWRTHLSLQDGGPEGWNPQYRQRWCGGEYLENGLVVIPPASMCKSFAMACMESAAQAAWLQSGASL